MLISVLPSRRDTPRIQFPHRLTEAYAETASCAAHAGPGRRRFDARRTGHGPADTATGPVRHLRGGGNPLRHRTLHGAIPVLALWRPALPGEARRRTAAEYRRRRRRLC